MVCGLQISSYDRELRPILPPAPLASGFWTWTEVETEVYVQKYNLLLLIDCRSGGKAYQRGGNVDFQVDKNFYSCSCASYSNNVGHFVYKTLVYQPSADSVISWLELCKR